MTVALVAFVVFVDVGRVFFHALVFGGMGMKDLAQGAKASTADPTQVTAGHAADQPDPRADQSQPEHSSDTHALDGGRERLIDKSVSASSS